MNRKITFHGVKVLKGLAALLIVLLTTGYSLKAQTDTKTMRIYAPGSGSMATDSVVLWRKADSTLYKVSPSAFASGATTNTVTVSNDSIFSVVNGVLAKSPLYSIDSSLYKTDGTLQANRTVTFGGNTLTFATGGKALYINSLPTGTTTDKLLTLNNTNGQVDTLSVAAALSGNTTNVLTVSNDSIFSVVNGVSAKASLYSIDSSLYKTDGTLQANRTVTFGGNTLTFATGGKALYINNLPTGTTTDKLLTLNSTSGQVDTLSVAAALSGNSTNTLTLSKTATVSGNTDTLISTVNSITAKQFIYGQGRVACNSVTDVSVTDPSITATSTIIVTYVNLANSNTQSYMISSQSSGNFNVHFGGLTSSSAYINYMVLP